MDINKNKRLTAATNIHHMHILYTRVIICVYNIRHACFMSSRETERAKKPQTEVCVVFVQVCFQCPCMSVPPAGPAVVFRYCQLSAARIMAADTHTGEMWWCTRDDSAASHTLFSRITLRICSVFSRDGSEMETFCSICGGDAGLLSRIRISRVNRSST